jgi:hypothetical protein
MAEITFLAPGSCQLEVTAQGNVGTDTGVDLASVSWTIEQALIAGCRFSPSAGDVHIDRNGVLTIGRSLFDRINQADGDDAIPGQCTLIIRADSTITKTVLDRFKVLVGYPGEGGGSGGGGESSTQTLTVTKESESDVVSVQTIGWADRIAENFSASVEVEPDSTEGLVSVYSIPVGACFNVSINSALPQMFIDAEMTISTMMPAMPSTPLYAKNDDN